MTYKEEIKKLIFEKLLLGLVVGLAIHFGAIQLEEIKANESFKSELNKVRILKVAEVWEQAAQFEMDFYKLYNAVEDEIMAMTFDGGTIDEIDIYKKENIKLYVNLVTNSRTRLFTLVKQNSFYLGPNLKEQVYRFQSSLAFVEIFQKMGMSNNEHLYNETVSIEDAKKRVEQFRADITQIRKYIINGGW